MSIWIVYIDYEGGGSDIRGAFKLEAVAKKFVEDAKEKYVFLNIVEVTLI